MGKFLLFFLFLVIFVGAFFIQGKKNLAIFSPEPKIDSEVDNTAISNNWFPKFEENWQFKNSNEIYISSKSAILVDYDSGEIIYAKNADAKLPAASTIKIMTAMVALDNKKLSDTFRVSAGAVAIGENSMGLQEGEILMLEELIYGMMLVSGNDAAISIAEGIVLSEEEFVKMMNEKVTALGLDDTRFVNATGLDEDTKSHYTTVYDMATIARYVWENYPEIRKIASTYEKYIERTNTHKDYLLYNDTNLLTSYPGVKGIKPGFTWNAGWCLVTHAENEGKRLLGVILGSEDRRGEMVQLLDYGFGKYGIKVDHPGLDL